MLKNRPTRSPGTFALKFVRHSALLVASSLAWACAHQAAMTTAGPGLADIIANPSDTHKADTGDDRPIEVASLLGVGLRRPFLDSATAARLNRNLTDVADSLRINPSSADALVWYGRRLGYLGRYREAIDTFAAGIKLYPSDPRFYRHRGQRYLTIRRPALAIQDFQKAAMLMRDKADEIEPDGAPNARNTPLTTLHFNVWYHLAVALYVRGDYGNTLMALDSASHVSVNADTRVATTYWRYLTLRQQAKNAEAANLLSIVSENLDVIENASYLKALQMFAGQGTADALVPKGAAIALNASDAVTAYAASMSYFFAGQRTLARDVWKRMMGTDAWPSFGVLAAEAELERAR
ncbi:MAG: hypothetical protein ABJB66_06730 [Gemmatimonadaceae bacterium]